MIKLNHNLSSFEDRFPLLFEIVQPAEGNKEKRLQQHINYLEQLLKEVDVDALNIPEIQDEGEKGKRLSPYKKRVSPRKYAKALSEQFDVNFVINRVVVKQPHHKQEKWMLETYEEYDINHIILVGGESSAVKYNGPPVSAANRLAKRYLNYGKLRYSEGETIPTDFTIGNICIPTRRRNDFDEPERMYHKIRAGADFFTSQIITEPECIMKSILTYAICFLTFLLFITVNLPAQDRLSGETFATRSEVIAENGMAATNHPLATQIAIDILKKGGSAVDAAIAANAFLGFADPAMNGLGGDMFVITWSAGNQQLYGLNASGKSPKNLTIDHFKEQGIANIPASGPLPLTVPGVVDGWFEMHNKFGRLDFKNLLKPVIDYARSGIAVHAEVADMMDYLDRDLILHYSLPDDFDWEDLGYFSELYRPEGRFPVKGERFRNPDLANTLELIANEGREVFYRGPVAERIVNHVQEIGGFLTLEDFAAHSSEWVEPVSVAYRDVNVWQLPPPTQGLAVLQMLNILEGFDNAGHGFGSPEHIHYFAESKKLAYADLGTYYGDPEFSDLPVSDLLSKEYAEERRSEIRDDWTQSYGPGLEPESHTIYLTTADTEGNMVSLIQSNSWLFGSLVAPPCLGFPLQNRGTGFTLTENHVNTYAPGKRPFHTIIPAFVTKDGEPYISFGLTGGDMQPQGHVQIVLNMVDFGMNIQEAGDAPRIRHSGSGTGAIELESGFDYRSVRSLLIRGHEVKYGFERFGGFQGIMYDGSFYYGASESRKDGQAAGY